MKVLHLVCNAHLDLVWMWDWDEGACAALGTFYSAVELANEYEYIFCHNEAILYQYIEKYNKELFSKIQKLVEEGKWHIMGGWYIQPDCMLPSGESFIRQITTGREYFEKKFNSKPTVAVNFDSFGHTKGLVQILKKCGYDGYIFCRPMPEIMDLPDEPFFWKGYDGSKIKAIRINDQTLYCTDLGHAKENILRKVKPFEKQEIGIALWGVGNHGGGASRKDLQDIIELQKEKEDEYQIIHSTPEEFFKKINPSKVVNRPLPCFIKSYSSISSLKMAHATLENVLYKTEKALALAEITGKYSYEKAIVTECENVLCSLEFHDVLSGTCARNGEESSLRKAEYAKEILSGEFYKAFHAISTDYLSAKSGENPFVIFNYQPYSYETVVETEFLIPEILVSNTEMNKITVYQDGEIIPSQVIKELSNINYDRRKRIAYKCRLNPLGVTRVDVKYEKVKGQKTTFETYGDVVVKVKKGSAKVNIQTGLLESYIFDDKEYLSGGAFEPIIFKDNEDPWGWNMSKLGKDYKKFGKLLQSKIIEDGDILTEVESIYLSKNSKIKLSYKIYKDFPMVDVNYTILWGEDGKGLKIKIPTVNNGKYFGQVAYGLECYKNNGEENISHRYIYEDCGEQCLAILSSGIYSNCKIKKDLFLTLLNGSVYCAHPIGDRPLVDNSRFVDYIENGKNVFNLRMIIADKDEVERKAMEFSEQPYSINMYPHGKGNVVKDAIVIDNSSIVISAIKKLQNGCFAFRLFNNSNKEQKGLLKVDNKIINVSLNKFSFETYKYSKNKITKSKYSDLF